jgi:YVTN family beta-propeller protein
VNPTTNRIYVSNSFESSLSVIDGVTNNVVDTIGIGFFPDQVAVNPMTNRIYVANTHGDSISVIDGTSGTVLTTIPVGVGPEDITVDATRNRIYNTNGADGTVTVIDGTTSSIIDTISVGTRPLGIDVNPLTARVYVANGLDDTVSVIASATQEIDIDIKPGNKKNVINPRAKGGIWVAILSNTDSTSPFDPSSQVNAPTVEFGPDGAKAIRYKVKDINKDGLGDLLLRFKIPETGIACGDTEATLTGEKFDGQRFSGTDTIKTVGCRAKEHKKKK